MEQADGRRRPPRWGIRTLGFLALAAASVIASNVFTTQGTTDFVLLTFLGLVVGLVGAAYCSYRGLRSWSGLP